MPPPSGFQLTARDLAIVRFCARYRLVTCGQIRTRFAMSRTRAYARLQALTAFSLIRRVRGYPGGSVYLATARGIKMSALDLPTAFVSPATLVHDMAVCAVGLMFETRGFEVLTERQLRRFPIEQYSIYSAMPGRERHWPDLAIKASREHLAVEVELTAKGFRRLTLILGSYAASPVYGQVIYVVPDERIADRIRRAGAVAGLSEPRLRVVTEPMFRQGEVRISTVSRPARVHYVFGETHGPHSGI